MRFVTTLFLASIACAAVAADSITLTDEDDAKGGKRLGAWMAANDFDATTLESNSIRVKGKVLSAVLTTNLTKEGLDRILVMAFFSVKDENKTAEELPALTAMVMSLNARSNIGCFSLDKDNDLVLQSQLTFIDTLDREELEKFLSWFDTSAFVLLTKDQQAAAMLK